MSNTVIIDDAAGCICKGNWRLIMSECRHLIGEKFKDSKGKEFVFYGLVYGADDYYYGMWSEDETKLLSCVGSIEAHGYTQIAPAAK